MFKIGNEVIEERFINESFWWIVDNKRLYDKEAYRYNRDFVHSFGLKCDDVGWCRMKEGISEPFIRELYRKAAQEKVSIRGYYSINLSESYESEWYLLKEQRGRASGDIIGWEEVRIENKRYEANTIKAFKLAPSDAVLSADVFLMLRQPIVHALQEAKFTGIDFMWVRDTGRYESSQYFLGIPSYCIPWCFSDGLYQKGKKLSYMSENISAFGEKVKLMWNRSSSLHVEFPLVINRETLPETDFAGVALRKEGEYINGLLVRKSVRDFLIARKLVHSSSLEPVLLTDIDICSPLPGWSAAELEQHEISDSVKAYFASEYAKFCEKARPKRVISRKMVLSELRKAKRMEKEYFHKALPAKKEYLILDERLLDYYKISNGGCFSSGEYTYFSAEELGKMAEEFREENKANEESPLPEKYTVFGICADGEWILLLEDGNVVRYQSCDLEYIEVWKNTEDFFYDALRDECE